MNNHHYNKNLKEYAKTLRTESVSKAEKYLWKSVLRKKKTGVIFKRQRPLDHFIVDFLSQEIKLIIEIDGSSHLNKSSYDRYRQDKLENLGYKILRFEEGVVLNNINVIQQEIEHAVYVLKTENPPPLSPSKGGDACEPQAIYKRGFGLLAG